MSSQQSLVEVKAEQASLHLPPPAQSVQTAPLPADVDFDKFWDALVEEMKAVEAGPNVNSSELIQLADDHFMISSDVKSEKVASFFRKKAYKIDKGKGEIREEVRLYKGLNMLLWAGLVKVHRGPLRVEYSRQLAPRPPEGRLAGEGAAGILRVILGTALKRKVQVTADQASPSAPGQKSAVSEPLDDFASRDKLYDAMCEAVKAKPHHLSKAVSEVVKEGCSEPAGVAFTVKFTLDGQKIKELPPEHQKALADIYGAGVREGADVEVEINVQANRGTGSFALLQSLPDGRVLDIFYLKITADPLRVDICRIPIKDPVGGETARQATEYFVNRCIRRVQQG